MSLISDDWPDLKCFGGDGQASRVLWPSVRQPWPSELHVCGQQTSAAMLGLLLRVEPIIKVTVEMKTILLVHWVHFE